MAWRRVVCAACVSENYLKVSFLLPISVGKSEKPVTGYVLSGVLVIKIFCVWAAHTAAFYGFGNNV